MLCGDTGWRGCGGFVERGKPENQEKNPRSKDKNQQQTSILQCGLKLEEKVAAKVLGSVREGYNVWHIKDWIELSPL